MRAARSDSRASARATYARSKRMHYWPLYVFAHWELSLSHTCDCGLVVNLQNGKATQ